MASGDEWDARQMFELYLHDYMVKKKMHKTAHIFKREAKVYDTPVEIDSPDGFFHEWWSIFYDVFISRQTKQNEANEDAFVQPTQTIEKDLQNVSTLVPQLEMIQRNPGKFPMGTDFDMMFGQPAACFPAAKMFEEERLSRAVRDFNPSLRLLDVNEVNLSKTVATTCSHPQQIHSKQCQQIALRETRQGIMLGRNATWDPTLHGVPKAILPRSGPHNAGLNEGVNPIPLRGWPLSGVDRIPHGLGPQVLNSLFQVSNHQQKIQTSTTEHQQRLFAQLLSCEPRDPMAYFPGTSTNLISCDTMFPKDNMDVTDRNDRKRKISSYVRPGDNILVRQGLSRKFYRMKSCIKGCEDVQDMNVDENVEFFLSQDEDPHDTTNIPFSNLKRRSSARNNNEHKGFSFQQVGCLHSSKGKVLCCHFSSGGNLLACAGHDKKVLICNMDTFEVLNSSEGHSHLISDIRFRPNSTILATSSFDRTVQIWDAARPRRSLFKLLGHAEQVTSLDFHPQKVDLLCSCDGNSEIRLWNVNQSICTRVSKGATQKVRFQPRSGDLLATAIGNRINLIDVETNSLQFYLEGHVKEVRSICWDTYGKYIATVSEDSARVWSVAGGKCIHELHSDGNNFQSCTFHPGYSQLLVIGGYQTLQLWNPTESSKMMTVSAHNGLISALADSPQTEIIASVSHDQWVKLWK